MMLLIGESGKYESLIVTRYKVHTSCGSLHFCSVCVRGVEKKYNYLCVSCKLLREASRHEGGSCFQ